MNSFFRKLNSFVLCVLLVLFFTINISAQLSGIYIIGSGGDFATIQEACDSLMSQGVTGDSVHFYILPGTYHEQVRLSQFPIPDDSTVVEFASSSGNPEDVVIYYEPPDVSNSTVFHLNGADNLLFKNLSFHSLGQYYSRDFLIEGNIQNLHFENCIFKGVYKGDNDSRRSLILFYNSYTENLIIKNCQFSEGAHGIESNNADYNDVIIEKCRFTRIGYEAISLSYAYHTLIKNNVIRDANTGINIFNSYGQDTIACNDIYADYQGIDYSSYYEGGAGNLIMNNIIRTTNALTSSGGGGLIHIRRTWQMDIYHNTLINYSNHGGSRNIFIRNSQYIYGINIINNLIINFYKGYTFYVENPLNISECHHNIFYTAGPIFAYWDGYIFSLEELQNVSGKNQLSMEGIPFLRGDTSLVPVSPFIDNKGTPVQPNLPDFFNNLRDPHTPDVGAIEFTSSGMPPMHGIFTIGAGGDYSTLNSAIHDALLRGEDGDVTFAFLDGSYTLSDTLFPIPRTQPDIKTEITSNSLDSSAVTLRPIDLGNQSYDYIFIALGSSPYHIHHLSLKMYHSRDGALLADGYIKELSITNNFIGHEGFPVTGAIDDGLLLSRSYYENIRISNNYFEGSGRVIIANHSGATFKPKKLEILNNEFHVGYSPLYVSSVEQVFFENNLSISSAYGPSFRNISHRLVFRNNIIGTLSSEALIVASSSFHPYDTSYVVNNFFSKMNPSNLSNEVVELYECDNLWFTNNNIKGYQSSASTGLLRLYNQDHLHFLNNIIVNDTTGYAIYTYGTNYIDDMDYNNYFTRGPNLAYWINTPCENLDSLRNLSGMDTHSFSVPVTFTSSYDLHINEPALDNKGTPLPFVKKDIDGDYRHPLYPDLGADEFTPFPTNPPYVVNPIPDQTIDEDQTNVTLIDDLQPYFSDPDTGDILSFKASTSNSQITLAVRSVPPNRVSLSVTPAPNYFGEADIIVTATDLTKLSVNDTFRLTVLPVPDNPLARDDQFEVGFVDSTILSPLANDTSYDQLPISIIEVGNPAVGSATLTSDHSGIIYYPSNQPWTNDSMYYVIQQAQNLLTDTAWIYIQFKQLFSEMPGLLPGYRNGGLEFIDFDQDGYLDIFIGANQSSSGTDYKFYIYRNNQGESFSPQWYIPELLQKRIHKSEDISIVDFDHDNDPDIVLSVEDTATKSFEIVFIQNYGNTTTIYPTNIPGYHYGQIHWIDTDNDGELELITTGEKYYGEYEYYGDIYKLTGQTFSIPPTPIYKKIDSTLLKSFWSGIVSADFDQDGDMDLFMTGMVSSRADKDSAQFYRNDGGRFVPVYTPPVSISIFRGDVRVGDFDGDGKPDVLYSGYDVGDSIHTGVGGILYNRIAGPGQPWVFENYTGPFNGGDYTDFADFDNDGDPDIIMYPYNTYNQMDPGMVYENLGDGIFRTTPYSLPPMYNVSGAIGDIDNDGRVDLILIGSANNQNHTYVFKNQCENNNSAPNAPVITNVIPTDSTLTIEWVASGDDHTSNNLLSYNLSVSDEYYESNIISSCSRLDGVHLTSDLGNIGYQDTWTVTQLTSGKLYYFKLQAIDAGRMASQFSDPLGLPVLNDRYMEVIKLPFALERGIAADFNQDGMMDVIGEQSGSYSTAYFQTYYNSGYPSFEKMMEDLPQNLQNQEFCAGDMNGDGYVDALINGYSSEFSGYGTYVYLYNPVSQHFEPASYSPVGPMKSIEIGDMDNDGDLDLIGKGTSTPYNLRLMVNQGGGFTYIPIDFAPRADDFDIGDIDNDGNIDIISNVSSITDTCVLAILFNRNGTFIADTTSLRAPESAVFQLLDFDNDGDLDLLATGHKSTGNTNNPWHRTCYLYENQHANFILKDTLETAALDEASIDVADFDNDGDTDFIIRGFKRGDSFASTTSLFLNDGTGNFIRYTDSYLPIYKLNGTAFAIKTLTQNLDFVLTGINNNQNSYSSLVMNTMIPDLNQPPSTPQNLKAEVTPDSIVFSWDASTDDHTPSAALTYNLRIGTSSGQGNIKPSHTKDNMLLVARAGNVGHVTRWILKNPPTTGSIYWTVQAVDNSYRTSEFAPEQVIVLTDISGNDSKLPKKFALHQNYPNPFNPATEIKFDVPKTSHVTIKIYNALGQLVTTLVDKELKPGYHKIKWDATRYPSGIYFYRMTAENFVDNKKMILLK